MSEFHSLGSILCFVRVTEIVKSVEHLLFVCSLSSFHSFPQSSHKVFLRLLAGNAADGIIRRDMTDFVPLRLQRDSRTLVFVKQGFSLDLLAS